MRLFLAFWVAMLCSYSAFASSDLLRCSAIDSVAMTSDGQITAEGGTANFGRWAYGEFIIDLSTGAFRRQGTKALSYVMMQRGDAGNDWVFAPTEFAANVGLETLRIRAWSTEPAVTFIAHMMDALITGKCEPVL